MANFGIGIGAFMNGMAQGMNAVNNMQDAKDRKRLRDIQFQQLEQDAADKQALRDVTQQGASDARAARQGDIGKSIIRGTDVSSGVAVPTFKVGDQTFATEKEANAAAEKQVGSFMDYYMKTSVPKLQEHWLSTGHVDKAQAIGKWLEDENVKKGVKAWAGAVRAFQVGDRNGFKNNLIAAYNQKGYFDDGMTAESIDDVTNDKGQLLGYKIKFKDAQGKVTEQQFDGDDVANMALNALSPEQVLSHGMDQLKQAQAARAELAKEERAYNRDLSKIQVQQGNTLEAQNNKAALDAAAKAEERRTGADSTKVREANAMAAALRQAGWSDEKVKAEMPRLLGIYRQSQSPTDRLASTVEMLAKTDTKFARMTDAEKAAAAKSLIDSLDAQLAGEQTAAQPGAVPAPAPVQSGKGIPVWDNKTNSLIYR